METQIFGMYIGQRVNILNNDLIKNTRLIKITLYGGCVVEDLLDGEIYPIATDACQLILKSISEMSEEDRDELNKELNIFVESYQFVSNLNRITAIKFTFWLISHGYALSDEWFTNGIAIKESEAK